MAKKNTVLIDVVVNGQMKKVSVDAAKLGVQLDNVGKSAHTADRNLKGAAQASANGTKNFSKMAQGVGGLVGVYATLAATAFAVSAAFEFFKSVGDLRVLQDSQIAYASSTGTALKTLSNDIRSATDGMLEFQEASQAAAIGVASGLTPKQLTDLAEGASAVSKILGRDVSDSFDRLVRGVTKAEPELLDELGITLRLEDAKKKFAAQIGKTAKSLSLLEQKQAVAVEVQTQLEEKFISTSEAIEVTDNAVKKLGVAFSDVFNTISTFLAGPVEGIANFLANNIKAFIAVIALFAVSVTKSMMPSFDAFVDAAEDASKEASNALKAAKEDLDDLKKAANPTESVRGALKNVKAEKGSGIDRLRNQEKLSKRQAATLLRFAEQEKGVYNQLTAHQKLVYKKSLRDILGIKETFWQRSKRGWSGLTAHIRVQAQKIKVTWRSLMASLTRLSTKAATAIGRAFSTAFSVFTTLLIVGDIAKSIYRKFNPLEEQIKEIANMTSEAVEGLKTMATEFGRTADGINGHLEKVSENMGSKVVGGTMTSMKTLTNFMSNAIPKLTEFVQIAEAASQVKAEEGIVSAFANSDILNLLDTTEGVAAAKRLAEEIQKVFSIDGLGVEMSAPLKNFINLLNSDNFNTGQLKNYTAAVASLGEEFQLQNQNLVAFNESFKASELAFTQLITGITNYNTKATELLSVTEDEIRALALRTEVLGSLIEGTREYAETTDVLIRRLAMLKLLHEVETQADLDRLRNEFEFQNATRFGTTLINERAMAQKKISDMDANIANKTAELATLVNDELIPADDARVQLLAGQLGLMMQQRDVLEEQEDVMNRLGQAGLQGLETGMQGQFAALLKGEQKSGKDAVLNMLKSAAESVADELANQFTESIMGGIRSIFKIQKKKTPEELMREAIETASAAGAAKYKQALMEGGAEFVRITQEEREQQTTKNKLMTQDGIDTTSTPATELNNRLTTLISKLEETPTPITIKTSLEPLKVKIVEDVTRRNVTTGTGTGTGTGTSVDNVTIDTPINNTKKQRTEQQQVETTQDYINHTEQLNDSSVNLNDSTKKLDLTMNQVGNSFSQGIASMVSSMGAPGSTESLFFQVLGQVGSAAANAAFARNGAILEGYSNGGIARGREAGYPAILHGTEAVVPLPNGKQIPVEMKGGAGQQNNIAISVNVDNKGGATTEVEGDRQGADLGKAIAGAVQQELLNQKRAGGILSPYGVS